MSKGSSRPAHRVAILLGPGSNPFEMSVASEVFGLKRPELEFQPYEVIVCASTPTVRLRDGIFDIVVPGTLRDAQRADTIIVPNRPDPLRGQSDEMLAAIRTLTRKQKRIIGFCTGAFSMGDAGILDDRNVTTHWRWAQQFSERFPTVSCQPDVLFVDDGQILTAAGSASAIDLCLYVVQQDFGASVAHSISRRLVFALHRPGGQQQFIETPPQWTPDDRIAQLCIDTRRDLAQAHSVSSMARGVTMAPSTFHRNFLAQVGIAPMQWLQRERIDAAKNLLESAELTIEEVATRVGLGTSTNLRVHFRRTVGMAPSAYRAAHRSRDSLGTP
jgi:AraC family transcriptional regulator, transcriptional activator FtrA